ncbi:MAG: bifunctional riboflavin kinase/FAD synthetase [Acidimicrobiales bacterium]
MEVVGPDCVPAASGSAVTVGAYDGVHLGHRRLLSILRQAAERAGLQSVVVTFDRHPATVVRPESAPAVLTDLDYKLELLGELGIDRTVVVPFDDQRAQERAEDFVQEVLVGALRARVVVVGPDFHFGHKREGDVSLLCSMGGSLGFSVEAIDPVAASQGSGPVSSTRIRRLIAEGRVAEASELLVRDHEVHGPVVRGAGRGARLLGFPTANLRVPVQMAVPAPGVYAGRFAWGGSQGRPAAISVGEPPTFASVDGRSHLVEAHVLDLDEDLYGAHARVSFQRWIRGQKAFEDLDTLVEQMARDVQDARGHRR